MSHIILLYCVTALIGHSGFAANSEKNTKSADIILSIYLIDIVLDLLVRLQIIREWIEYATCKTSVDCYITLRRAEGGD